MKKEILLNRFMKMVKVLGFKKRRILRFSIY
jgi:hypothetical protein